MRVARAAVVLGLSTPLVVLACGGSDEKAAATGDAGSAGEDAAQAGGGGSAGTPNTGGSSNDPGGASPGGSGNAGEAGTTSVVGVGGAAGSDALGGSDQGGTSSTNGGAGGAAGEAGQGGANQAGGGAGGQGSVVDDIVCGNELPGSPVCFNTPVPLMLGEGTPTDLAVGSWDSGTTLDILVASTSGLSYYANTNGNGAFTSDTYMGATAARVAVGDLGDDGGLDLLLENGSVTVAFGDAEGGTLTTENQTLSEGNANNFFVGDVLGSGASQDFVMSSQYDIKVVVTSGIDGEGYVASSDEIYVDGAADAVLATLGAGQSVVFSHGTDVFRAPLTYTTGPSVVTIGTPVATAVGGTPLQLDVADFNEDGFDDVAATLDSNGNLKVLFGDGAGAFATVAGNDHFLTLNIGATVTAQTQRDVKTGDFNGDGHADIAVSVQALDAIAIFSGDGAGAFAAPHLVNTGIGSGPTRLAVGDLNEDGVADLTVIGATSSKVIVILSDP